VTVRGGTAKTENPPRTRGFDSGKRLQIEIGAADVGGFVAVAIASKQGGARREPHKRVSDVTQLADADGPQQGFQQTEEQAAGNE